VVVDSSKRPANALLLAASDDIDLFVVHLVRDPRGVANSWEFARDPADALKRITTMVERRPRSPSAFLDGRRARLGPNHTAVGNRNRFLSGEVTIRCDEAWREQMRTKDKLFATPPSLPLLTAYGYPVLPATAGNQRPSGHRRESPGVHSGRHG
jgi:hypothetical protein